MVCVPLELGTSFILQDMGFCHIRIDVLPSSIAVFFSFSFFEIPICLIFLSSVATDFWWGKGRETGIRRLVQWPLLQIVGGVLRTYVLWKNPVWQAGGNIDFQNVYINQLVRDGVNKYQITKIWYSHIVAEHNWISTMFW